MPRNNALPVVAKTLRRNQAMLAVASAATGLMRQLSIKSHKTSSRRRELYLRESCSRYHAVRCQIFREKGNGSTPTIVIAGFVPDATEVVEFQRPFLKTYGDIYYLNYPRTGFSSEMFMAQLADLIEEINNRGEGPILFSISFGCGLTARFLRGKVVSEAKIRGIVMVSPVLCTEDLVRPHGDKKGGVRLIESNLRRILKAESGKAEDVTRQVERARRCFQSLFEAGAENRTLTHRHLSIRRKIMEVIALTTATGAYERVNALKEFPVPDTSEPIFTGQLLTLLAEMEDNMLVPTSPSLAVMRCQETHTSLFPNGIVRDVRSLDAVDAVAHASLIFHHSSYNPLLKEWYEKTCESALVAVV
ncbi:MAG: alpha/beta hydrolase [Geobacteraceae bacterium]